MSDRPFKLPAWILIPIVGLMLLLTACTLPTVKAEDRVFLNLAVDFLDEYQLPQQEFQATRVGGLSGITYDRQRDRFYVVSDDRSEFAPARFYTLKLVLDQADVKAPKIQQLQIERVTPITAEDGKPYPKGTIDAEGIVLSPLSTLFISSEGSARDSISPFVREFDLKTGQWKRSLPIPTRYLPEQQEGQQVRGVQDNLGFESLTLSPSGYGSVEVEPFRLFTATESSLVQDQDSANPEQAANSRLLHYLAEPGRSLLISEHLYPIDPLPKGALQIGLVELLAIDQGGHFLSLERSYGLNGFGVKLYQLAMADATDISNRSSLRGARQGIQPIRKKLLLDLNQLGLQLENLEGMTLGPQLADGSRSLLLVSDNNFQPEQPTQFLLLRLK